MRSQTPAKHHVICGCNDYLQNKPLAWQKPWHVWPVRAERFSRKVLFGPRNAFLPRAFDCACAGQELRALGCSRGRLRGVLDRWRISLVRVLPDLVASEGLWWGSFSENLPENPPETFGAELPACSDSENQALAPPPPLLTRHFLDYPG